MKRKVFIVDDHPVMRWGYTALINSEPDLMVCGESGAAQDALEQIATAKPDLVVVDISLQDMNGIDLTKHLQALYPELPVLIISMHDEGLYGERALRAGARGYLMKTEVRTCTVEAIRRVLQGAFYLSDQLGTRILLQYQGKHLDSTHSLVDQLSDREIEVFELFGRGFSTREIAEALLISPKTVESHRNRIKEKLVIDSTSELLQRAVQWAQRQNLL